jgi:hypothetical protein
VSIIFSKEEIEALPPHAIHRWWNEAPRDQWEHMILHPDNIQSFRALDTHEAPIESGIYMLFGADGGLDYVGKAKNINKRLREHLMGMVDGRRPPYSRFAWMELPRYAYHDIEVAHIYAMEPPQNRLYEPIRWARHKELVGLIQKAWE